MNIDKTEILLCSTHCNLKSTAGACLIGFDLTDGNIGQHACSSGGVVFPTRGQRGRSSGKLGTWPPIGSWERTADDAGRRSGLWEKSALCKSAVSYLKGWLDGGDLRLARGLGIGAGVNALAHCNFPPSSLSISYPPPFPSPLV